MSAITLTNAITFRPRMTMLSIIVVACMCTASVQTARCEDGNERLPNIVMIISDDQSWTDYGFAEHPVIKSPRLDQLAAESAVFPRGYVPTALCRPSLATMITGLYAHQHRITGNDPTPLAGTTLSRKNPAYLSQCDALIANIDRVPTLPKLLGEKGYISHQSGKWWEGNHRRGGFTAGMTHGDPTRGGRHGDEGLKIGRRVCNPSSTSSSRRARNRSSCGMHRSCPTVPTTPRHDYCRSTSNQGVPFS